MAVRTYYYPRREIRDLKDLLYSAVRSAGARSLFRIPGEAGAEEISYSSFLDRTEAFGTRLCELGYAGRRTLLVGENSADWACAFFSAVCAGGSVLAADAASSAEQLTEYCRGAGIGLVISSAKCAPAAALAAEACGLPLWNLADSAREIARGTASLQDGDGSFVGIAPSPDAEALLLWSAERGEPFVLTHGDLAGDLSGFSRMILADGDDCFFAALPWSSQYSVTSSLLLPLVRGSSVGLSRGFRYLTRDLQVLAPTVLCTSPALVFGLWRAVRRNLAEKGEKAEKSAARFASLGQRIRPLRRRIFAELHDSLGGRLRFLLNGGLTPENIARDLGGFGLPVLDVYGLRGGLPLIAMGREEQNRPGSCGLCVPGGITDIYDRRYDGVGEIRYKADAFSPASSRSGGLIKGWLHTGDLGSLDRDGYLWVLGKKKNIIPMAEGYRIIPEEIESMLRAERFVRDARITSFLNETAGRTDLVAVLVPDAAALTAEYGPRYAAGQSEAELAAATARVNARLNARKKICVYVTLPGGFDTEHPFDRTQPGQGIYSVYLKKLSRIS